MQQQKVFKRFITIPPTSAVTTVEDSLGKEKKTLVTRFYSRACVIYWRSQKWFLSPPPF